MASRFWPVIGTSNAIKSLSLRDKPQEDDTKLEVDKSKFQPTEANAEAHDVEAEYKELRLRFVALEETATNTDREKVELVRQVKRLEDNQIDLQERLSNVTAEHTEIQQKNHEMRKTLQDGQADNQKLREQITQWKVAISASTQSEDEVADDTIAMKMDEIFYKIQGFVVKHFRGTTFNVGKGWVSEHTVYADSLPKALWFSTATMIVAKALVSSFVTRDYFGRSEHTNIQAARILAETFKGAPGANQWLADTHKLLESTSAEEIGHADALLYDFLAGYVHHVLGDAMPIEWSDVVGAELRDISRAGHELYRTLRRQRAHFWLELPLTLRAGKVQKFKPEWMVDMNNSEDETVLAGWPLETSVFPAVLKRSGGTAATRDPVTVVSKAKVIPSKQRTRAKE